MKLKLESVKQERWSNLYYNPEKYGLRVVAQIDYSDGSYQFDYRVVWADKDGALWTARDSGCSCPSPFESTDELDRLFDWDTLQKEYDDDDRKSNVSDWRGFEAAVKEALAALKGEA